jgi:hypothetical protein
MSDSYTLKPHPSLTAVVHQVILRAPNGLDAAEVSKLMGYSNYNTMMAELTQPDRKFDMDRLLPAMDATGSDAPMHFLARQRSGVFLRTPEPAKGGGELAAALASSAKEYAEFMQETAASIADGDIPPDQLARITKEGMEAVEAIMAMLKLARVTNEAQHGGGK